MNQFHAVVFDFDGVIVDTEKQRYNQLNKLLKERGHSYLNCDLKEIIGKKTDLILKENFPQITETEIATISAKRRSNLMLDPKPFLIKGLRHLLKQLEKQNIVVALTTGTQRTVVLDVLNHYDLENFFKIIISGEDFSSSKPDPECYLLTIKKLNIPIKNILVVEDSPAGIIAAKKAGLAVAAIETYYEKKDLPDAEFYFKNHEELLKMLFK